MRSATPHRVSAPTIMTVGLIDGTTEGLGIFALSTVAHALTTQVVQTLRFLKRTDLAVDFRIPDPMAPPKTYDKELICRFRKENRICEGIRPESKSKCFAEMHIYEPMNGFDTCLCFTDRRMDVMKGCNASGAAVEEICAWVLDMPISTNADVIAAAAAASKRTAPTASATPSLSPGSINTDTAHLPSSSSSSSSYWMPRRRVASSSPVCRLPRAKSPSVQPPQQQHPSSGTDHHQPQQTERSVVQPSRTAAARGRYDSTTPQPPTPLAATEHHTTREQALSLQPNQQNQRHHHHHAIASPNVDPSNSLRHHPHQQSHQPRASSCTVSARLNSSPSTTTRDGDGNMSVATISTGLASRGGGGETPSSNIATPPLQLSSMTVPMVVASSDHRVNSVANEPSSTTSTSSSLTPPPSPSSQTNHDRRQEKETLVTEEQWKNLRLESQEASEAATKHLTEEQAKRAELRKELVAVKESMAAKEKETNDLRKLLQSVQQQFKQSMSDHRHTEQACIRLEAELEALQVKHRGAVEVAASNTSNIEQHEEHHDRAKTVQKWHYDHRQGEENDLSPGCDLQHDAEKKKKPLPASENRLRPDTQVPPARSIGTANSDNRATVDHTPASSLERVNGGGKEDHTRRFIKPEVLRRIESLKKEPSAASDSPSHTNTATATNTPSDHHAPRSSPVLFRALAPTSSSSSSSGRNVLSDEPPSGRNPMKCRNGATTTASSSLAPPPAAATPSLSSPPFPVRGEATAPKGVPAGALPTPANRRDLAALAPKEAPPPPSSSTSSAASSSAKLVSSEGPRRSASSSLSHLTPSSRVRSRSSGPVVRLPPRPS